MPTVESIAARIEREGEPVTVSGDDGLVADVKAFVRGYRPEELVNDINQGDREVRIAPIHLLSAGFARAPVRLDTLTLDGMQATVQSCETRKLRGLPAMHVIQVRGG